MMHAAPVVARTPWLEKPLAPLFLFSLVSGAAGAAAAAVVDREKLCLLVFLFIYQPPAVHAKSFPESFFIFIFFVQISNLQLVTDDMNFCSVDRECCYDAHLCTQPKYPL